MRSLSEGSKPGLLGLIPARGGSKSIPRKNARKFLGKPLLAWTVEVAVKSNVFERVLLSTDDAEIAEIGRSFGADVPFVRPPELAQDTTLTVPVVRHAVEWLISRESWKPDYVVVLEPTAPGRRIFHIREAADLLIEGDADSVASVSEVPHHCVPPKVLELHDDGSISGLGGVHPRDMVHRRQDLPIHYTFDGIVFSCRTELVLSNPPTLWGEKVLGYVVDSRYSVDIDRPEDWAVAESKLQQIFLEEEL